MIIDIIKFYALKDRYFDKINPLQNNYI